MTTPTGTITMAQVNAEIGRSPTANTNMNEQIVRRLASTSAPIPTKPPSLPFLTNLSTISMNDLRGKKARIFASGGTILVTPTHATHIFTSPGTFNVSYTFPTAKTVDYLVVAGGGLGATTGRQYLQGGSATFITAGGGGGGGGFRYGTGLNVPISSHPIIIGGSRSPTIFSSLITSIGGGDGGTTNQFSLYMPPGGLGGSGGGGAGADRFPYPAPGGNGISSPPQGKPGGSGTSAYFNPPISGYEVYVGGGGGGGAGQAGDDANVPPGPLTSYLGGPGGNGFGVPNSIIPPSYGTPGPNPSLRYFSGGGGGGSCRLFPAPYSPGWTGPRPVVQQGIPLSSGIGGKGGGGHGNAPPPTGSFPCFGKTNTGGGGGGGANFPPVMFSLPGGNGGSGFAAIRYEI